MCRPRRAQSRRSHQGPKIVRTFVLRDRTDLVYPPTPDAVVVARSFEAAFLRLSVHLLYLLLFRYALRDRVYGTPRSTPMTVTVNERIPGVVVLRLL
jgi:hypothetical protein